MHYYKLIMLSYIKRALGYLLGKVLAMYNAAGAAVQDGIAEEESRIEEIRAKNIARAIDAKDAAVEAAVALTQQVTEVEEKEAVAVQDKLTKLRTKVK